jgi:polysaccharide pyruvyl transferase WcaK-like protein
MNVLLINDSSSNPNWGDRAASIALQSILAERGSLLCGSVSEETLSHIGFFRVPLLDEPIRFESNVAKAIRLITPPLFHLFGKKLSQAWNRTDEDIIIPTVWNKYSEVAERWMRETDNWAALKQGFDAAEVVIVHGDGAIATRSNIAFSMLFLIYLAKFVLRKPVGIINHTVDTSDSDLQEIVRNLYPSLDVITFRETKSVERCKDFCDGRYVPDSGFWFSPAPKDEWAKLVRRKTYMNIWPFAFDFDPSSPYICIGGSSLFYPISDEQMKSVQNGYVALVEKIKEYWNGQFVFVASDIRDEDVLKPVAIRYKAPFLPVVTPVQQAVDMLGHSAAYVGGRWHTAIFALRGGAPVVPLTSKTFKISALCEMAGLHDSAVSAHDLEKRAPDVASCLDGLLKKGEPLRGHLRAWAAEQAMTISQNVSIFESLINPQTQRNSIAIPNL